MSSCSRRGEDASDSCSCQEKTLARPSSSPAARPQAATVGVGRSPASDRLSFKFAQALPDGSPFAVREALAGKDGRTLARAVLSMDVDAYRAAFSGSPMKRAKLPAMKRNAAVVLGNVGSSEDVPILVGARVDAEPLVRGRPGTRRLTGEAPRAE